VLLLLAAQLASPAQYSLLHPPLATAALPRGLLLRAGIETNPGPRFVCAACPYNTDLKQNMTRHVKFSCGKKRKGEEAELLSGDESRRSKRLKVIISYIF
jgi:hypothetical protein